MVQTMSAARAPGRAEGRIPPHNLEAEESLLGAMMLSRDAIAAAVEIVREEDFYRPSHAHVFEAVVSLYGQGEPVDPVTVAEELRRAGLLDSLGGKTALLRIQASTPAAANAAHYARIVEEHALLRRLISAAGEIAEMGFDLPDDVTETLDRAESLVFEVADRRVSGTLVGLHTTLQASLDHLEALYGNEEGVTGTPTGFHDLDGILLGLQPSNLVVVAARPGMGKTSFALGAATTVALESNKPVVFFSMEMGHLELTQRLLSAEARVDARKLRTGKLGEGDWEKISHAVGRLANAPFFIDDNPHCTVMEVRAKCRRLKARQGDLGLVVVDYLQLMSSSRRAENRQVEVAELSRGLKILARELEVPVIALSQLNRQLEYRQDKRPMLADLRESGCVTGDTRIARADTGDEVPIADLLDERDIPVWTVDDRFRLVRGVMTKAFPSGEKEVFDLVLSSGRRVKASANHPFLTVMGWVPLGELAVGRSVAVPRGFDGLHHAPAPAAATGARGLPIPVRHDEVVPGEVWEYIRLKLMPELGLSDSEILALAGMPSDGDSAALDPEIPRARCAQLALETEDLFIHDLATSDVRWDRVVDIVPLGVEPVFDATVPGTHAFLADGIVVHNSIEQDADVVIFLYRDETYNPESDARGTAEVIVAKHRNGPTGISRLAFLEHFTSFANMARA